MRTRPRHWPRRGSSHPPALLPHCSSSSSRYQCAIACTQSQQLPSTLLLWPDRDEALSPIVLLPATLRIWTSPRRCATVCIQQSVLAVPPSRLGTRPAASTPGSSQAWSVSYTHLTLPTIYSV